MKLIRHITLEGYFAEMCQKSGLSPDSVLVKAEKIRAETALADPAGGEVWEYNDIGFLSGSRGLCLVREGKPVKYFAQLIS